MDKIVLELFASDLYKKCFREVVPANKAVGSKDTENLEKCIEKYHQSYNLVGNSFVNFVNAQPKKGSWTPPDTEDE